MDALADRSHASLISWTGRSSIRVFQMLSAGKIRQWVPGTEWAGAGSRTDAAARGGIAAGESPAPRRAMTASAVEIRRIVVLIGTPRAGT